MSMCFPSGDMLNVGLVDAHAKCSKGIKSFSSEYESSEMNENIKKGDKRNLKKEVLDLFIIKIKVNVFISLN
ncbi:MAG: hypothetical protein VW894_05495 [Gammaproteobacteria bacterium]